MSEDYINEVKYFERSLEAIKHSTYVMYLGPIYENIMSIAESILNDLQNDIVIDKEGKSNKDKMKEALAALADIIYFDNKKADGTLSTVEGEVFNALLKHKVTKVKPNYLRIIRDCYNQIPQDGLLQGGLPGLGKKRKK